MHAVAACLQHPPPDLTDAYSSSNATRLLCHVQALKSMCDALTRCLPAIKATRAPLLRTVLPFVMHAYQSQQHPCCLDTIAAVVEHFGELKSDPEVAQQQQQVPCCIVDFSALLRVAFVAFVFACLDC